ncbi:TIGD5 [Bugula neritina]|uniref:TIGD5 n=1 Tax=Bugula neritina TaxID=10212 RepID=A0A7J7K2S4_BUGNE|nr:TIGD5 [Bugula neritina]
MPKRKLIQYTLEEKFTAVRRIRNGERQCAVSRDMGVHEATLRGWLRDEGKLRAFADDIELSQGIERVASEVPEAPLLQSFSLHDEGASIDKKDAEEHISQCYHLIQEGGYTVDQVYKADETGLHWRQPPRKIISPRSSHIQDFNEQNERLTVLVCTNRSGSHQLKPLVIGKYRSPQCFHHVKVDCLPVVYDHSIKGLMTATTLENWFHKSFVPAVKTHLEERQLEAKALLLLNSCPAHLPAEPPL